MASLHRIYGPENDDVALHQRELLEQGLEVAVVKYAMAAARRPDLGDGYRAARANFGIISSAVHSTDEVIKGMGQERA